MSYICNALLCFPNQVLILWFLALQLFESSSFFKKVSINFFCRKSPDTNHRIECSFYTKGWAQPAFNKMAKQILVFFLCINGPFFVTAICWYHCVSILLMLSSVFRENLTWFLVWKVNSFPTLNEKIIPWRKQNRKSSLAYEFLHFKLIQLCLIVEQRPTVQKIDLKQKCFVASLVFGPFYTL